MTADAPPLGRPYKRDEWMAMQRERETAARDTLASGVARAVEQQGWREWLQFAARFPRYSFANQLLLQAQRPGATLVMSATDWRQVGRYPARGSTALRIWAPRRAKIRREPDRAAGERQPAEESAEQTVAQPRSRTHFVLVPVFDVAQTDGEPLPAQPQPIPPPMGQAPTGMWDALASFAHAEGFSVGRGPTGAADGVTDFEARRIVIADKGSDLAQTLVLAHEIGHMGLHADPAERTAALEHRGRRELEAESVAYSVAAAYGLHQAAEWHFDYLAHWSAAASGGDPAQTAAAAVRAAADQVLRVTRPLLEHLAESGVGLAAPAPAPRPEPPVVAVRPR